VPSSQQSSSKTPSPWGNQPRYGEYEIVGARENRPRLLGEGSFGKTFEAMRVDTVAGAEIKEYVAVKVLNPALLKGEAKRFQFIQELLALSKFKHSNLIHYIRCGEERGEVYYAMELCRGGDLARLVRRYGALPEKVVALIALQVAAGLREVHQRHRLVHRDIKPSNIMLVDELEPELERKHLGYRFEQQDSLCRVVDFGLVNFTLDAAETSDQRFVGSPMYASPEQIREQPVDGRSDIYSLGMTLWYLVQGKGPLLDEEGEEIPDMDEAMRRHTEPEEFTTGFPEHLSTEFREILGRMVAKRPDKRFASAQELQNALRQYLCTASDEEEVRFSVTRVADPLDSIYELEEKIPSHGPNPSYVAREKTGGRRVKVSVVANVDGEAVEEETAEVAERLCKLAELSQQPSLPEALMPVRSVVWAADLLAYTEEMFPHLALSEVLKARANARRPIGFAEAVSILRPIAEALDFLLQHGQETVSLPCEEVWLTGPAVGSLPLNAQVLTTPLDEWNGLQVRFSMMFLPPRQSGLQEATASTVDQTMSGSLDVSGADLHPVPVFARLVYRILNGSEVAAAVQFSPHAYVPAVTLGHASNNLLRDLLARQKTWSSTVSTLKDLCANEGVVWRSGGSLAVAEVVSSGVVRSPYASHGSTQTLPPRQWQPGGEFICAETGKRVALPHDLPSSGSTGVSKAPLQRTMAPPVRRAAAGSGHAGMAESSGGGDPPPLPKASVVARSVGGAQGASGFSGGPRLPQPPAQNGGGESLAGSPKRKWMAAAAAVFFILLVICFWPSHKTGELSVVQRRESSDVSAPSPAGSEATAFEGRTPGDVKVIGGIPFRWCPPTGPRGFMMGSPESEKGRAADELLHEVILTRGFWIAETELTQGQWQEAMGTDLREQAAKGLLDETVYPLSGKNETIRDYIGLGRTEVDKAIGAPAPATPVYWVNWLEAVEYCQRLSESGHRAGKLPAGWQAALPTESQWEYACRAGVSAATYAGDLNIAGKNNAPILDDIAWYGGNSGVRYAGAGWDSSNWPEKAYAHTIAGPRAVAGKRANSWGLCDALGNVLEWCSDWQAPYPYGPVTDPVGPAFGTARVIRGGGWYREPEACRAAARAGNAPGLRGRIVGFRPVISKTVSER
jgi:serine/threonine protein kinase/formylglycine-generating enzyme required for sulfatase activity